MRKRWAIVAVALALGALAVLLTRIDLSHVGRDLAGANWWWVAASALANVASSGLESARWSAIVAGVKAGARWRHAFAATLVGTVGNVILPFKLGEGARAFALSRFEDLPVSAVLSTVVIDRVVDVTLFFALALGVAGIYPPPPHVVRRIVAGLAVAVCAGVVLVVAARWFGRVRGEGDVTGPGRAARLRASVARSLAGLRATGRLAPASVFAALSWFARTLVVWTMFKAFGIDLPLGAAAASLVIINIGIVSVSTPGNVGVFELTTVAALALHGVPSETAVSFAVVLHAAEVVPTLLLGLGAMWRLGIRAGELAARAQAVASAAAAE